RYMTDHDPEEQVEQLLPSRELQALLDSYKARLSRAHRWLVIAVVVLGLSLIGITILISTLLARQDVATDRGERIEQQGKDIKESLRILRRATSSEALEEAAEAQRAAVR